MGARDQVNSVKVDVLRESFESVIPVKDRHGISMDLLARAVLSRIPRTYKECVMQQLVIFWNRAG